MAEYTVFKFFSHLPWKTAEFDVKISTVMNNFFTIQDFWATCACPESRVCPEFTVLNIYFLSNQDFWATCACPEKHELPWCFSLHWNILSFRILSTLSLPWKQRLPWIHCIEYILFIIQDFWATCACPENRVCTEIFQDRGGGRPPRPPASYAYGRPCPSSDAHYICTSVFW